MVSRLGHLNDLLYLLMDNDKYQTLISQLVKASGKWYDPHNAETENFTLYTGLTEPFIQSNP